MSKITDVLSREPLSNEMSLLMNASFALDCLVLLLQTSSITDQREIFVSATGPACIDMGLLETPIRRVIYAMR